MKKILILGIAALLSGRAMAQKETKLDVGDAVPTFAIGMLDGSTVNIADLKGKVVVLNFWATWCPYCIKELDHIVQTNALARFEGDDFIFIAIDRGEERQTVKNYADRKGYTFPIGLDQDETIFKTFAESGIPRTYIVGRDGVITGFELGYSEEIFGSLVTKIEETLKK